MWLLSVRRVQSFTENMKLSKVWANQNPSKNMNYFGRSWFRITAPKMLIFEDSLPLTSWTQDVKWTYKRRLEDVLEVFWTSYVRSVYVLCPVGKWRIVATFSETSAFTSRKCIEEKDMNVPKWSEKLVSVTLLSGFFFRIFVLKMLITDGS